MHNVQMTGNFKMLKTIIVRAGLGGPRNCGKEKINTWINLAVSYLIIA